MITHLPAGLGVLALSSAATAALVYDSISTGTDGVAFFGDTVIDDLTLEGGGLLTTLTVDLTAAKGSGTITTDVSLILAVDGGDGVPDLTGMGDDAFLFQVDIPGVELTEGEVTQLPLEVTEFYPLLPEDALLFSGIMFSNPSAGHLFNGTPSIGVTDDQVFSFVGGGPVPVPSVGDPRLESSDALAFALDATTLPGPGPGSGVIGDPIGFESLEEGFQGTSVTVEGVTFADGRDGFPPPLDATFAIDDGTEVWEDNPAMLDFVGGKLLQINALSPGAGGYTFAALKSMKFSDGRTRTGAKLNIAYVVETDDLDYASSVITLAAMTGDKIVATDMIHPDHELGESSGGTFTFGAGTLLIAGPEFDELVLFNNGPAAFGIVLMGVDNVVLGTGACGGDFDGSGTVGFEDLLVVLEAWGPCPAAGECLADIDGDGVVGFGDLIELLSNWGPCSL